MSSEYKAYYNEFYRELAKIDALHNTSSKIRPCLKYISPGSKVLDIGCGHGTVVEELIEKGCEVYGIETNEEALEVLKKKKIKAIDWDFSKPFALQERFNLILLLDVLEHSFSPLDLLKNAAAHLAGNGIVCVQVPLYFDLVDRIRILFTGSILSYDNIAYGRDLEKQFRSYNYDHIRFFRPKDVIEMLKLSGLRPIEIHYQPLFTRSKIFNFFLRVLCNRYVVNARPQLFAHSMFIIARQ